MSFATSMRRQSCEGTFPRQTRSLRKSAVTLVLAVTLGAATAVHASDPQPQSTAAGDAKPKPTLATVPRVPVVTAKGPVTKVEGKITRSSRGRKGPVRVLVERASGSPVTVLFATDEICDRLGVSLKTGEQIVVEGSMLKSERPILIATTVTENGKVTRIRDDEGKVIDPAGSAGSASSEGDAKPAVVGGGKPSPESSPAP